MFSIGRVHIYQSTYLRGKHSQALFLAPLSPFNLELAHFCGGGDHQKYETHEHKHVNAVLNYLLYDDTNDTKNQKRNQRHSTAEAEAVDVNGIDD